MPQRVDAGAGRADADVNPGRDAGLDVRDVGIPDAAGGSLEDGSAEDAPMIVGFTPSNVGRVCPWGAATGDLILEEEDRWAYYGGGRITSQGITVREEGTDGDTTGVLFREVTDANSVTYDVICVRSIEIPSTWPPTEISFYGDRPVVVVAEMADIGGTLTVRPGNLGGHDDAGAGVGATGAYEPIASTQPGVCRYGWASGGGGGSYGAVGGRGGAVLSRDGVLGGSPGTTYGNESLVPLRGGSAGGRGGGSSRGAGSGGAGGGALQLSVRSTLRLHGTATITVGGGGGGGGGGSQCAEGGGGGGGSGGSLLLEADTITTSGRSVVLSASGGGGGAGGFSYRLAGPNLAGAPGEDGGRFGGEGARASMNGTGGGTADDDPPDASDAPATFAYAGGGGGGMGLIRVNTANGAGVSGVVLYGAMSNGTLLP